MKKIILFFIIIFCFTSCKKKDTETLVEEYRKTSSYKSMFETNVINYLEPISIFEGEDENFNARLAVKPFNQEILNAYNENIHGNPPPLLNHFFVEIYLTYKGDLAKSNLDLSSTSIQFLGHTFGSSIDLYGVYLVSVLDGNSALDLTTMTREDILENMDTDSMQIVAKPKNKNGIKFDILLHKVKNNI